MKRTGSEQEAKSEEKSKLVTSHLLDCRGIRGDGSNLLNENSVSKPSVVLNVFDTGDVEVLCPYFDPSGKCTMAFADTNTKLKLIEKKDDLQYCNPCRYNPNPGLDSIS